MHLGSAASKGGEGTEGASVLWGDGVGFLLHRSFSVVPEAQPLHS